MKKLLVILSCLFVSFLFIETALSKEQILTILPQDKIKNLQEHSADINGVRVAWTEVGDPEGVPVLMLMGWISSYQVWGDSMVFGLSKPGYRIILMDNRDVGGSEKFDHLGEPYVWWNVIKFALGLEVNARYTLRDMANDAVGLLDHLDIQKAHVVGISMGAMIAQVLVAENPERSLSLISLMSSTAAPHLPKASSEARKLAGELLNPDEPLVQKLHELGIYPEAARRQLIAMIDAGDLSETVKKINVKTLVIHGADDIFLALPHGEHVAKLIHNSKLVVFPGMNHCLPEPLVPEILEVMISHLESVDIKQATRR